MKQSLQKPKIGKLIQIFPSGRSAILESGKPFPILQVLKQDYIHRGYKKETLKITY